MSRDTVTRFTHHPTFPALPGLQVKVAFHHDVEELVDGAELHVFTAHGTLEPNGFTLWRHVAYGAFDADGLHLYGPRTLVHFAATIHDEYAHFISHIDPQSTEGQSDV